MQQSERGSFSKEEICSEVNREDISHFFFKIEKVLNDLVVDFDEIIEARYKYSWFKGLIEDFLLKNLSHMSIYGLAPSFYFIDLGQQGNRVVISPLEQIFWGAIKFSV